MRIMLDTNVIPSVAAFGSKSLGTMLGWICQEHQLVLSTYVVEECYEVVRRKKPALVPAIDRFFEVLPFEMVHTPQILPRHDWFTIRDAADEKVLYSATSIARSICSKSSARSWESGSSTQRIRFENSTTRSGVFRIICCAEIRVIIWMDRWAGFANGRNG